MLHTSSSCCTPVTRKLLSTVFMKLGNKAPLKKLRNLKLSLGRRVAVLNLTEGLVLSEADMKLLEDTDKTSSEQ